MPRDLRTMSKSRSLNKYIDHTNLSAQAGPDDIRLLCAQARQWDFFAVCVNSRFVGFAKRELAGSDVKVAAVVGFPLGAMSTEAKVAETEYCCASGADEIDMVMAVGMLKAGYTDDVRGDIAAVVECAASHGAIVKVILETCCLTDDEIVLACRICEQAGAAFVKTSTGFGSGGATEHAVRLMRSSVGPSVKVKASGGIRSRKAAEEMISAGADRIGTSSGVAICAEVLCDE